MSDYLTQRDVENYGHDLLDLTQRSALHVVAPHLQNLEQQNAELRQRLAVEARRNLDQRVAQAVPDFREIDQDPRWHQWLLGVDQLSGRPRQVLLNDAINSGDAGRIAAFFNGYRQAAGQAPPQQQQHSHSSRGSSGKRIYSRDDIRELYEMHRCGEFTGREAEWNRIEADIFAAQREGRILNPDRISK